MSNIDFLGVAQGVRKGLSEFEKNVEKDRLRKKQEAKEAEEAKRRSVLEGREDEEYEFQKKKRAVEEASMFTPEEATQLSKAALDAKKRIMSDGKLSQQFSLGMKAVGMPDSPEKQEAMSNAGIKSIAPHSGEIYQIEMQDGNIMYATPGITDPAEATMINAGAYKQLESGGDLSGFDPYAYLGDIRSKMKTGMTSREEMAGRTSRGNSGLMDQSKIEDREYKMIDTDIKTLNSMIKDMSDPLDPANKRPDVMKRKKELEKKRDDLLKMKLERDPLGKKGAERKRIEDEEESKFRSNQDFLREFFGKPAGK